MEENMAANVGGKRVAGGGKGKWIVLGVLGVLAAAYLALCVWVRSGNTALPNVSVLGRDVSGMTEQEVQNVLGSLVQEYGSDAVVTLEHEKWSGSVSLAQLPARNPEQVGLQSARMAVQTGRENFFLSGISYLSHLLGRETEVPFAFSIDDTDLSALNELLVQARTAVSGDMSMTRNAYHVEDGELVMIKGATCTTVDVAAAEEGVKLAFSGQMFDQLLKGGSGEVKLALPVHETAPEALSDFQSIRDGIYTEVVEPTYDKETGTVTEHEVGVDFDVNRLKAAYEAAGEGETIRIPLILTQPKDTRQSYESKLFADTLGSATSKVSGTANRKTNVKLSAQACDGVILLPGEEFSYNNTTGSRTADKGYLPAPTYNGGASVDDVGGGICQTSSTIYYALLHTTLEVVERQNHSYATGYVPDGMDATVFYGSLDFRFKNNTNYPVKVSTESYDKNGSRYLKVTLVGTNESGYYAKPTNTVYDVVSPTKSYVADSAVERGTLVLDRQQNAYTGRKAQVTRTVYAADGTVVESQNMGVSRYKMRPHLYHYNPLDGNPSDWPDGVPPKSEVAPPVAPPDLPVTPVVPDTPAPEPPVDAAPQGPELPVPNPPAEQAPTPVEPVPTPAEPTPAPV